MPYTRTFDTMQEERDETIERVRRAIKPLPPTDAHAVARVLSAVHGRTPQPTPRWREFLDWMRAPSLSFAAAGSVAVAALFVGYMLSGTAPTLRGPNSAAPAVAVAASPAVAEEPLPVVPVSTALDAERAVPVQFVLDMPSAASVSVVGDFNEWAIDQAPMQKFASGAWSVTIPVKPGRHEYAFVIDGKKWMADPRAPRARDNDFGKPGSVIVVNTP
ncbi:MAG: isoamylase early set domain-containing protein [Phycisphaerae bacterium]|nr:isoamylase early set domain-containing protein [Gemmatimonadaceae bacterium]